MTNLADLCTHGGLRKTFRQPIVNTANKEHASADFECLCMADISKWLRLPDRHHDKLKSLHN